MVKRYPGIESAGRQVRLPATAAGYALPMLTIFGCFRTDSSFILAAGPVFAPIAYFVLQVGAGLVEVVAVTVLPK